jgi:hypothetical protein
LELGVDFENQKAIRRLDGGGGGGGERFNQRLFFSRRRIPAISVTSFGGPGAAGA